MVAGMNIIGQRGTPSTTPRCPGTPSTMDTRSALHGVGCSHGAQTERGAPIRFYDTIAVISGVEAEMIQDQFGVGCLAFARQSDNHDESLPLQACMTIA
jgi:hypothetical protein